MDVNKFKRALEITKEIETLTSAYEGAEYAADLFQSSVRNRFAANPRLLDEATQYLRSITRDRINQLQKEFSDL